MDYRKLWALIRAFISILQVGGAAYLLYDFEQTMPSEWQYAVEYIEVKIAIMFIVGSALQIILGFVYIFSRDLLDPKYPIYIYIVIDASTVVFLTGFTWFATSRYTLQRSGLSSLQTDNVINTIVNVVAFLASLGVDIKHQRDMISITPYPEIVTEV